MPSAPVTVLVDAGLDDAVALCVLTGLGVPLAQVVATEGSLGLLITAAATRRLLVTLGNPVPVRLGADSGLRGPYPDGRDPFHGSDGFGGQAGSLAAAGVPAERVSPESLAGPVFCGSALTCVAGALAAGAAITEITWMGGAVAMGGNMTAAAEFNAWMDPPAADAVLSSGLPVRMVPLDITERFAWSGAELAALRQAGRAGSLLASALGTMVDRDGSFVPHDAVTVIAMVEPELFRWEARPVRCETRGEFTAGATVVDRRPWSEPGTVLVAADADVARVSARILAAVARVG
jgi:inosine-uridine nucleoside N-ribohydrolase